MTYIPKNKELISKESVLNLILKYGYLFKDDDDVFLIGNEIKALPTFSPEAIIEEMIEEFEGLQPENWKLAKKDILQEALSRIRAENIS